MNPFLAFFRVLADPTIVALLFSTGSIALVAELYSPNFVTGILGALMILLALIGAGTLPLNIGGLLLILLGMVLFGLEVTVTSHGLLGFGGVLCLALGLSFLFTGPSDPFEPLAQVAHARDPRHQRDRLGHRRPHRVRRAPSRAASAPGRPMVAVAPGVAGEVRAPLSPFGSVFAAGEEWTARTADGRPLDRGTPVRIVKVDGLTLTVEPDPSSSTGT